MDSLEVLAKAGYRVTGARRAVIAVLSEASGPLSPQEILERARGRHARLGLVTVYRTLSLCERLGLVKRVHRAHGCHGYVGTPPGHQHVVICRRCGRSYVFQGQGDLDALTARLERETGYRIEGHLLQFFGLCPRCERAMDDSKGGSVSTNSEGGSWHEE